MVEPGAFIESLKQRPAANVKMLLHHNPTRLVGVFTDIREDRRGLKVKGQLLLKIQDGVDTLELMRVGALDALSIGYRTLKDEIDRVTGIRRLLKLLLMEVSLVTFPMNDRATISRVKSLADMTTEEWRELEATLRDEGLSRAVAVKAVSGLKVWLQRDAGGPDTGRRDDASAVNTETLLALRRLTASLRG